MQKRWIPILVFCLTLFLVAVAHLGGRAMATPTLSFAEEKEVYLTFDDGPSTVVTNSILDTLKREQVKATFFIVGERVEGREEVLRRIVREGHTAGIHSFSHRYDEIYASDEAFLADVKKCAELVTRVTGTMSAVYRFPGGGKHPSKEKLLEEMGYTVVGWNAVCGDEEIPHASRSVLVETTFRTAKGLPRVVLLLHDSAPHRETAAALPEIIARFRDMGYVFRAF